MEVKILASGESQRWVGLSPEQASAFYQTPMNTADGEDTVLGEFLAGLWDKAIQDAMASPVVDPLAPVQ